MGLEGQDWAPAAPAAKPIATQIARATMQRYVFIKMQHTDFAIKPGRVLFALEIRHLFAEHVSRIGAQFRFRLGNLHANHATGTLLDA
jgi:hypothetical protein